MSPSSSNMMLRNSQAHWKEPSLKGLAKILCDREPGHKPESSLPLLQNLSWVSDPHPCYINGHKVSCH